MQFWTWLDKHTDDALICIACFIVFGIPILTTCMIAIIRAFKTEHVCECVCDEEDDNEVEA